MAGVFAGFLSLSSKWVGWKYDLLKKLRWKRPNDGGIVIWNGVDKLHNPPSRSYGSLRLPDHLHNFSHTSAADWPDTSLPQISLDMEKIAVT